MKNRMYVILIIMIAASFFCTQSLYGFGLRSLQKAVTETAEEPAKEADAPTATAEQAPAAPAAPAATDPAAILPFGVTIGGQEATPAPEGTHAVIAKPVPADATLKVDTEPGMVIINAFASDAKGNVASDAPPVIIMIQEGNETTLDQSIAKTPLPSGTHMLNIVVTGKGTARVLVTIE